MQFQETGDLLTMSITLSVCRIGQCNVLVYVWANPVFWHGWTEVGLYVFECAESALAWGCGDRKAAKNAQQNDDARECGCETLYIRVRGKFFLDREGNRDPCLSLLKYATESTKSLIRLCSTIRPKLVKNKMSRFFMLHCVVTLVVQKYYHNFYKH